MAMAAMVSAEAARGRHPVGRGGLVSVWGAAGDAGGHGAAGSGGGKRRIKTRG